MFDIRRFFFIAAPFLRKPLQLAYIYSIAEALQTVSDQFTAFRNKNLFDLQFTGQVLSMEGILNATFDPVGNGIFIEDGLQLTRLYLFTDTENFNDVWDYTVNEIPITGNVYEFANADYGTQIDFIVNVPAALVFDSNEMTALINRYRLASKRFIIQTY